MITEEQRVLKVYELEPKAKHPAIFDRFTALSIGESFIIENDHDPKPLYYQMLAQLGPVFNWEYTEQGPDKWKVILGKKEAEATVGSIAAKDARKAEVFKKLGIDFCCGGKKTLQQAAADAGITEEVLQTALKEKEAETTNACFIPPPFPRWEAGMLADYIYNQHHQYYYTHKQGILDLAAKVADVHAAQHPQLKSLLELILKLFEELDLHFHKEEKVLFPYIKEMTANRKEGKPAPVNFSLTNGPLAMMEMEHEAAGDLLKAMRKITGNYQCPADACNSFILLYQQLENLEKDLYQHIHLENNILFPKAIELEKD